jgi:NAD(P)H dehydrogenase (quinone)
MVTKSDPGSTPAGSALHCVIVAHPESDSFTMSVARGYCETVAEQGQRAVLRDLYRMNFDPVLKAEERSHGEHFEPGADIAAEIALIAEASALVLVYPIWFGTPPAIIKGYVERVMGAGADPSSLTHHLGQSQPSLLRGKHLLSFTSSGTSQEWLSDQGAWSALQTIFDGYIARAFWMDTPRHIHFAKITADLDPTIAQKHLGEVDKEAAAMCRRLVARNPAHTPV